MLYNMISNDSPQNNDSVKEALGKTAADLVRDGMLVGLGTGTTIAFFIKYLGVRCQNGLQISAVASSDQSFNLAKSYGIPLVNIDNVFQVDLTVDGADEIDDEKRLIKGGGGALLREKIIASMSKEMVVIVDSTKRVKHLGRFPLPVEIVSFAYRSTLHHLEKAGYIAILRKTKEGSVFITDNGNKIVDVQLAFPCLYPEKENEIIKSIPGVIETGFFFHLAHKVLIGYPDGNILDFL
jgi:ribose 5-phosphate isomerase A